MQEAIQRTIGGSLGQKGGKNVLPYLLGTDGRSPPPSRILVNKCWLAKASASCFYLEHEECWGEMQREMELPETSK